MANPPTSSISDLIVPFGYGAFGYGYGTYGGETGVLNPQWNTNSGDFGYDTLVGLPYVGASNNPSFVGASLYNIEFSSFFAKINPAPNGNGTVQTSLIIQANKNNFVEMYVGPNGRFGAYVANNTVPTVPATQFPVYDPTAHAFWRIRSDNASTFHFDVGPDGQTWTELGNVDYHWDGTSVTVVFLASFTGSEALTNRAYLSSVNRNAATLQLSATTRDHGSIYAQAQVTDPNALSGKSSGFSGHRSRFTISLGVPQGGLTDFGVVDSGVQDPVETRLVNVFEQGLGGGASVTWNRGYATRTLSNYRDGSYFPPPIGLFPVIGASAPIDTNVNVFTNVQVETGIGAYNRLSTNASFYTDSCLYEATKSNTVSGNGGSTRMERSSTMSFSGKYSGKMTYSGTPIVDGSGHNVYYSYPSQDALVTLVTGAPFIADTLRGSVRLSTTRAGTQWYAAVMLYDANFNLLGTSTPVSAVAPTIITHPGGGVFQIGTVVMPSEPSARYVGVIPVVIAPGSGTEIVYQDDHRLVGLNPVEYDVPTTYQDPQTVNITLKPDRLNYIKNSGFNVDIAGWSTAASNTAGTPFPVSVSWDGTVGFQGLGSLKATYVHSTLIPSPTLPGAGPASRLAGTSSTTQPVIAGLKAGHTYTFSGWVFQGPNCPDVTLNVIDTNYDGNYDVSVNQVKNVTPSESVDGWTRVQTTLTVPPGGVGVYRMWFACAYPDITNNAPFNFWIDSLMVEEVITAGDYFDGTSSSADYIFENKGNQNNRTYYYKDLTNKLNRLNTSLPAYAPLGSSFNIQYAVPS